jgi:hypothetical protein
MLRILNVKDKYFLLNQLFCCTCHVSYAVLDLKFCEMPNRSVVTKVDRSLKLHVTSSATDSPHDRLSVQMALSSDLSSGMYCRVK